jgi:hypothetical protein
MQINPLYLQIETAISETHSSEMAVSELAVSELHKVDVFYQCSYFFTQTCVISPNT